MKRLIPILLLIFFSTPVLAVEPITGAFGLKLGEVWDGEAWLDFDRKGKSFDQYYFTPEFPLDALEYYYVLVTPVKGLIYLVQGHNNSDCKTQYLVLKNALTKKYGEGEEDLSNKTFAVKHKWIQENRTIELECHRSPSLSLIYTDHFIEASRLDELAEQVDSSNL